MSLLQKHADIQNGLKLLQAWNRIREVISNLHSEEIGYAEETQALTNALLELEKAQKPILERAEII